MITPHFTASTPGGKQTDLVFILDSSSNVNKYNRNGWKKVLQFLSDVVKNLPISGSGFRVGVVVYGSSAKTEIWLDRYNDVSSLTRKIQSIWYLNSRSNLPSALDLLTSQVFTTARGMRANSNKIAVLITSSVPFTRDENTNHVRQMLSQTQTRINAARSKGINFFAVGVGLIRAGRPEAYEQFGAQTVSAVGASPLWFHGAHVYDHEELLAFAPTFTRRLKITGQVLTTPAPSES